MTKPAFQIMRWMLLSSKVLAFCRWVISSNWGCLHRPGEGVATTGCDAGEFVDRGVPGVEGFWAVVVDVVGCRVNELVEAMAGKEAS